MRRRWHRRGFGPASILVALLVSIACNRSTERPGHTFEIIEEDGVPVAVSSAIPKFEGELFTYEKILVIRPDPNDDESLLYRPYSFVLAADGHFYVADRGNHRVAVFAAAGRFVHAFGRQGDGPGELRNPRFLEVRDGVVFVFDNNRTTLFRTDGTFVDVFSSEFGRLARPTSAGSLFVEDTTRGPREGDYMYYGARGRVVDDAGEILASIETPHIATAPLLTYGGGPGVYLRPGDEILATAGTQPVMSWYDINGRLIRKARIDLPSEPVTEADRAAVEELWNRLIDSVASVDGPVAGQNLLALKEGVLYPETKAYWQRVVFDDAGWLWLPAPLADTGMSSMGSSPVKAQPWFRVVDADGEFIGVTEWPSEAVDVLGSAIVAGKLLTMVWDDEAQELLPTVYRIHTAAEGLIYP